MSTENNAQKEVKGVGTTANVGDILKSMSELSKSSAHPISQGEAREALNYLRLAVIDALKKGQKVQLTSFVTFVPTYRAARKGNNVFTKSPMDIPEGVVVLAKSGSVIKNIPKEFAPEVTQAIKDKALSKIKPAE